MRGGPGEAPGPGTTPAPDAVPGAAVVRQRREVLYFALRDKRILLGAAVVLFFVVLAIVGPWIDPNDPQAFAGPTGQAPSADYWFGTTTFGQDVFAQFVNGLQATFLVGLLGGGLAALIGISIGFVAGYRGGIVDEVLNMITNIVLVIPTLVVLVVIAAFLQRARGARGGGLHRPHLLAVGGTGHPRPDLLPAIPGIRRPGAPQRAQQLEDHVPGDRPEHGLLPAS